MGGRIEAGGGRGKPEEGMYCDIRGEMMDGEQAVRDVQDLIAQQAPPGSRFSSPKQPPSKCTQTYVYKLNKKIVKNMATLFQEATATAAFGRGSSICWLPFMYERVWYQENPSTGVRIDSIVRTGHMDPATVEWVSDGQTPFRVTANKCYMAYRNGWPKGPSAAGSTGVHEPLMSLFLVVDIVGQDGGSVLGLWVTVRADISNEVAKRIKEIGKDENMGCDSFRVMGYKDPDGRLLTHMPPKEVFNLALCGTNIHGTKRGINMKTGALSMHLDYTDINNLVACVDMVHPLTYERDEVRASAGRNAEVVIEWALMEHHGTVMRMIPTSQELLRLARMDVEPHEASRMFTLLIHKWVAIWWNDEVQIAQQLVQFLPELILQSVPFALVALIATDPACVKAEMAMTARRWTLEFKTCGDLAEALEMTLAHKLWYRNSITLVYAHSTPGQLTFKIGEVFDD